MTVATANNDPTILISRDEVPTQRSSGLAILAAESVQIAPQGDLDNGNLSVETIARNNELAQEVIQKHQGHVTKIIGAFIMAEFASPLAAVRAAVDIERLVMESREGFAQDGQPALRIGVHGLAGDCAQLDSFGSAVHVAAGITKHAAPGQILISKQVCDELSKESELHFQWFRKVTIEGQAENEDIFEVHWAATPVGIPSRYEALFQVGTGGMGLVYKVRDQETREIVALKVLRSEIASDPAMQENLRREVCLARKVTHKNVCRIHEFNRSNGLAYISMEFVEGASLLSTLQQSGPLPWNQALQIARQICAGLGEAHAQGIVHRDLKPANIMLDRNGVAKIMDFGIARPFQGTNQMTGTLMGTPAYMAPEQVELKGVDARTDVYALGLLLYEMVTGEQAFQGDTPIAVAVKQLREFPKRPRQIAPTISAHADAVIMRCLEKNPSKRFQSMEELAIALRMSAQPKPATAAMWWGSFAKDMQSYWKDLRSSVQPWMESAEEFVRGQDWKALVKIDKRTQKFVAAGLAATFVVGGLTMFTVRGARKHHAIESASMTVPAAIAMPNSPSPVPTTISADDADRLGVQSSQTSVGDTLLTGAAPAHWAHEVDLSGGADLGATQVPADNKGSKVNQAKKTQQLVTSPAKSLAKAKMATPPAAIEANLASSPADASPASTSPVASVEPKTEGVFPSVSSPIVATTPATTPGAAAAVEEKTTDAGVASTSKYFEVGSFKDSTWADQAVAKLTQLGFHAASIHKNLLWVQSYQVRVGPYTDAKELEAARKDLVSQGFKPHPVK